MDVEQLVTMMRDKILEIAKDDQILNAAVIHLTPLLCDLVARAVHRIGNQGKELIHKVQELGKQHISALLKALLHRIKLLMPEWVIFLLRVNEALEVQAGNPLYKATCERFQELSEKSTSLDINFIRRAMQIRDIVLLQKKLEPSVWDKTAEGGKVLITHHSSSEENDAHYKIHIHERHKEAYLDSLLACCKSKYKLYIVQLNRHGSWCYPQSLGSFLTLDKLALPTEQKTLIQNDLETFKKDGEFFRSVGRPWKRGYLLYGPPGTGKSSLIAAIANHLEYQIYELNLSRVSSNKDLLHLIKKVRRGSVIVIEDIDCILVDLSRSRKETAWRSEDPLSVSGIVNALDGLRSASVCDEKLFIFTSNHPGQVDPALLREGRMDMHIELSYCGYEAFMMLMRNYLKRDYHEKLPQIQQLVGSVQVTPAAISEMLMRYRTKPDLAIDKVIELLMSAKTGLP